LPLPATLAEKFSGFLAESEYCAFAESGRHTPKAIDKSNAGFFMFFPPLARGFRGTCIGNEKTVERPRFESILTLLAAAAQTQNLNVAHRRFALQARRRQCRSHRFGMSRPSVVLMVF
jgi:hypothetical protein